MSTNASNSELFETAGNTADQIDVKISHRIIQLFSEGLYSSPNKAIEELVTNSFDAGAENVHIILSPDLHDENATIVIIDDGDGMNDEGLKQHWVIGESLRRAHANSSGRKPIGKFGIGKLSTYVLGSKLTHKSKFGSTYYAATMDYSSLAGNTGNSSGGVFDEQAVNIPLRILSENEAYEAVQQWVDGSAAGYQNLKLFGDDASDSWTVAIISGLKPMGQKVKYGRLRWVLSTAMPQRSDFRLFLDGNPVTPPESDPPLEKLVLGKDIIQLSKPCPQGLIERLDPHEPKDSVHHYGVYHNELLGRITGYIEIFKDELDTGKEKFEQSSGFFVYVRGRRVNVDDPGFGIERNLLRHGTFSRFRMVVHIDSLDKALRSSRESFGQGELNEAAQNFLRAGFNLARNRLVQYDREQSPASRISASISSAPGSLTRRPILALARLVAGKTATPFYFRFPSALSEQEWDTFIETLNQQLDDTEGILQSTELNALDSKDGLAIFDVAQKKLIINSSHPFVAAFQEIFTQARSGLPLEMLAMSEILMEAHFYQMGLEENKIRDAIGRRDELLRQFVKSSARRTPGMIALALIEARDNENDLEEEMRSAFEAMGFANVVRIGGSGTPDGTAEAHLAASESGISRRYKVGLEAKSGQSVSAHRLNIAGIARHMEDYDCDHHLAIGNGFATSGGESSATVREVNAHKDNTGRTITLMHIEDLAKLVRTVAAKRIGGLSRIRDLFNNCITPEDSKQWVDNLIAETPENWPYTEILETIWQLAQEQPDEAVEYAAVVTELRHRAPPVRMAKAELMECCKAMQVLARGVVFARSNTVEIDRRPDLIIDDIKSAVGDYPEEERVAIRL